MLEKIGPVKNPLTTIAIFAAIVEVSSIYVLPSISSNLQEIYIWFLMLFPTLLVGAFFIVLWFKHYVLYAPSDYKDDKTFTKFFDKDFEENKILSATESVTNAVKENVQITENHHTASIVIPENEAEETAIQLSKLLSDNAYQRKNYSIDAYAFEHRIFNILNDLGISSTLSSKDDCMDIIARKKDGKIIPIEVKYYQAPLRGSSLVKKLADRINTCMDRLNTNESVLIISSSISHDAIKLLEESFINNDLHIVTGNTEDVLIPKLKDVFGLRY